MVKIGYYDDTVITKAVYQSTNYIFKDYTSEESTHIEFGTVEGTSLYMKTIYLKGKGEVVISNSETTLNKSLSEDSETEVTLILNASDMTLKISPAKNVTYIKCNATNINKMNLKDFINLNTLICHDNSLSSLEVTYNLKLQYLHCFNNPFIDNDVELTKTIRSLVNRNDRAFGSAIINSVAGDRTQIDKVESMAIAKNWMFGSPLMYTTDSYTASKIEPFLKQSGVLDVWETAEYGKGRLIGIMDTGFGYETGKVSENLEYGEDSVYATKYLPTDKAFADDYAGYPTGDNLKLPYHGNATSSVCCAVGEDMYGVCPKAQMYLFRLYDGNNESYTSYSMNGLKYVLNNNIPIDVMNLSFTSKTYDSGYANLCKQFVTPTKDENGNYTYYGIPFVVSAGNDGDSNPETDEIRYPACYYHPIVVGSINYTNKLSSFTNSYNGIDLVTYGEHIKTFVTDRTYVYKDGTSFSAPIITGCVALMKTIFMKKYNRQPTESELYNEIIKRTVPMREYNYKQVGSGRFNFMTYNKKPDYTD